MIQPFENLVARYNRLKERQDKLEENDALKQTQELLADIKMGGRLIVDLDKRGILKNLARDLGETIYHIQDLYPSVRLDLPEEGIGPNPFISGRPVVGNEFLNRDAELRTVFNRLRNGESTAISGEPHIGKTSLLLKLTDQATQQVYLGNEAQCLTVSYMDMHPILDGYTPDSFWEQALEPLSTDSVDKTGKLAPETHYSRNFLEQMFNNLGKMKRRLVLLVDEFERLLDHPNFQDPAFFGLLRSLTSRTGGLALVAASRYSVAEMNETGRNLLSVGSPFFNHLIDMRLKPFDEETVDILLGRAGDAFSPNDRRFIRLVAGTNPYLLQAMAGTLIETMGIDRYIRAAEQFYQQTAFHFDDLWSVLDDRMRTVVVIVGFMELARGILGQGFSCEAIDHIDNFGNDLRRLASYGWIETVREEDQISRRYSVIWQGEAWRMATQSLIWWVCDVALIKSRHVLDYDEWLVNEGYQSLLTQEKMEYLVCTLRDACDSRQCSVQMLADNLSRELVRRIE